MFLSPRSVTLSLSTLFSTVLIGFSANAAPLCEYAAYSTPALHNNLLDALAERGFAIAPAAYFSTSDAVAGGLKEEFWVLSDGQLYAKLSFSQDAVDTSSKINIKRPDGTSLAESKTTVTPCRGGWCRASTLVTVRDAISGSDRESEGLVISQEPSYGMRYLVYGEEIGVTSWRSQFADRYEWILDVLTDKDQSVPLQPFTAMQRFMFAMASKPALTPFLNEIDVSVARDGHFIVRGRMTHGAYNSMIAAALENGFYDIEPIVVIDSAAGEHGYQDLDLGRCLGRYYY